MTGVGGAVSVKSRRLAPVPPGVVTATGPVVAALGTTASISMSDTSLNVAAWPPKVTEDAPVKPVPVMVTDVPTGPLSGRNAATTGVGGAVTVKSTRLVPVPPGVVTATGPVVASSGTTASI